MHQTHRTHLKTPEAEEAEPPIFLTEAVPSCAAYRIRHPALAFEVVTDPPKINPAPSERPAPKPPETKQ
jgi:hypothetical protein